MAKNRTKPASLLSQIDALTSEASSALDTAENAIQRLRRSLVRVLLLWMQCQEVAGFLNDLYRQRSVRYRAPKDSAPTFIPLLKIIFGNAKSASANQSKYQQWNGCLLILHREYCDNPQRYASRAENKLLKYLNDNGGIDGLLQKRNADRVEQEEDVGVDELEDAPNPFREPPLGEVLKSATAKVKTFAAIGEVTTSSPLRIGDEDFIAILARKNASGNVTVIGSSNRRSIIELLSQSVVKLSLNTLQPDLRLLATIIKTQAYPPEGMPAQLPSRAAWLRNVYRDDSKFKLRDIPGNEQRKANEWLKASKKLLMRSDTDDIILSNAHLKASVVTRCRTSLPMLLKGAKAAMRGKDLLLIERMMETTEINNVRVVQDEDDDDAAWPSAIRRIPVGNSDLYSLHLVRGINRVNIFHFYDPSQDAGFDFAFQSNFDFDQFTPQWSFTASQGWFAALRALLLDKWFSTLGAKTQLKRGNNQAMEVGVEAAAFSLRFNIAEAGGPPPRSIPVEATLTGEISRYSSFHLSKDIAPVLYNLADLEVKGNVKVSGNTDAMTFAFKTPAGAFDIAVPAATANRQSYTRIEKAFSELRYG